MGLYENIKEICRRKGKNVFTVEKELGLSRGSISKFDKNAPSIKKLQAVANSLRVSLDDVVYGYGNKMYTVQANEKEAAVLNAFFELEDEDQAYILDQIRRIATYRKTLQILEKTKESEGQ